MDNKWLSLILIFAGASVVGQATHYFIGGDSQKSSTLRDVLAIFQIIFGLAVAFYGWKKYGQPGNSKT